MGDLYPTPTRLALLRDVANQRVVTDTARADDVIWLFPNAPTDWSTHRRVTASVREVEAARWVEPEDVGPFWRLTDEGRKVLADG